MRTAPSRHRVLKVSPVELLWSLRLGTAAPEFWTPGGHLGRAMGWCFYSGVSWGPFVFSLFLFFSRLFGNSVDSLWLGGAYGRWQKGRQKGVKKITLATTFWSRFGYISVTCGHKFFAFLGVPLGRHFWGLLRQRVPTGSSGGEGRTWLKYCKYCGFVPVGRFAKKSVLGRLRRTFWPILADFDRHWGGLLGHPSGHFCRQIGILAAGLGEPRGGQPPVCLLPYCCRVLG